MKYTSGRLGCKEKEYIREGNFPIKTLLIIFEGIIIKKISVGANTIILEITQRETE